MKYFYKTIFVVVMLAIFAGCSQKVTIRAIKPSVINDKDIKKISVEPFFNDNISLSSNIKSNISNVVFNNKKYFTLVNRHDKNKILKEQKLQDSGLVNTKASKLFELGEINSIITGKINSTSYFLFS
jgi:hypothetical protein